LRSFQERLSEFHKRGVEIAAISVDSPEESRRLCEGQGYTYPFLPDPQAEVIRKYGVLHAGGGEDSRDIAVPAEFLVDAKGTVRWVKLTDDVRRRARPEEVVKVVDELGLD
jgi:peroxiredoxin (alkyl hydroperoxide reductase subunit C)